MNKNILLLSTADWDNPFWTNKQHVAVELSKLGYKVLYVDSIGLRPPTLNKSDMSRILGRLLKGLKPPQKVVDNLWVWSPIVIPFQKYFVIRLFNKVLLSVFSQLFMFSLGFKKAMVWSYNPMTLDILYVGRSTRLIYHCVDDIKQQPGMPVAAIETAEKNLLSRADFVFVTSDELYRTRKFMNKNTHMFSNVADYDRFSEARKNKTLVPDDIARIKKPVIGFVGAISAYKLDFELIAFLAKEKPEWSIVLIGKVGEGEPDTDVAILNRENIYLLGPRPYGELPAYIKYFDVATIPVSLNNYTHSMFPMKFFEYLAAGKCIVSTRINSLLEYDEYVCLAEDYDDFIRKIEMVLSGACNESAEKRLMFAKNNTYKSRMKKMLAVIENSAGEQ